MPKTWWSTQDWNWLRLWYKNHWTATIVANLNPISLHQKNNYRISFPRLRTAHKSESRTQDTHETSWSILSCIFLWFPYRNFTYKLNLFDLNLSLLHYKHGLSWNYIILKTFKTSTMTIITKTTHNIIFSTY